MVFGSVSAILLALVLAASAVLKLRDLGAVTKNFAALGMPKPGLLSRLVPLAEVGLAFGLIVAPAWAGVAAFGLLAVFTAVLVSILHSGSGVACTCFGSLSTAPVSARHVMRNVALMALATMAAMLA